MKKYLLPLLALSFSAIHCTKENEKIVVQEKVTQGSMILSGEGVPSAEKGQTGDYYLDLSSSSLYGPKTKDGWGNSVLNLKGIKGDKGDNGTNGQDGITPTISEDGYWVVNGQKTNIVAVNKPHIGRNGNWWIGNEDLGVKAKGEKGQDGQNGRTPVLSIIDGFWAIDGVKTTTKAQGEKGQDGRTPTLSIIDGFWAIDGVKTTTKAQGEKGQDGRTPTVSIIDGFWAIDGVKTTTKAQGDKGQNGQNGRTPVLSIIDGFWAIDGVKTTTKAQGEKGQNGQDGHTPTFTIIDGFWAVDGVKTTTKAQGEKGLDGHTPVFTIVDGYWAIDGVKTSTKAQGEKGQDGQKGQDGSKILAENRAPQASDGAIGDYFIDKTAKIFYGPKTVSGWPTTGISLTGAPIATVDYELSSDGKTLVKWLNKKTRYIDMNADPKLSEVEKIANKAFDDINADYDLSTIIVGDKVTELGDFSFSQCTNLRRIELPDGLTTIGKGVFNSCFNLQYINIPETVTSLGEQAFTNCTKLKTITIPKGISSFGKRTFLGCIALHTLILENPTAFEIDKAGMLTFKEVNNLKAIYVPYGTAAAYKNLNTNYASKIKSVVIQ